MITECIPRTMDSEDRPRLEAQPEHGDPEKINQHVLVLECRSCGARWSNMPGPDGEFHSGFWRCPRGCDW